MTDSIGPDSVPAQPILWREYCTSVSIPERALWDGSLGEWQAVTTDEELGRTFRCTRCGHSERHWPLGEAEPMFVLRCRCDAEAQRAAWRAHFGIMADLAEERSPS